MSSRTLEVRIETLRHTRLRQGFASNNGGWIVQNETTRHIRTKTPGNSVTSRRHNRCAVLVVVGVSREKVNDIPIQQPHCSPLSVASPETCNRRSRNLNQTSGVHPIEDALGVPLQDGVSFRVGNDRDHRRRVKPVKGIVDLGRDCKFTGLNQQAGCAGNGVAPRTGYRVLNVFVGQVKVAPDPENKPVPNLAGELCNRFSNAIPMVGISVVCVRRHDDVGNSIFYRQAAHFQRHVPGFRAVIQARKNMGMNINH